MKRAAYLNQFLQFLNHVYTWANGAHADIQCHGRQEWVGLVWAMLCNFILCYVLLKINVFMCFVFQWYVEKWQQYCTEIVSSPCIATDRSIQDAMWQCQMQKLEAAEITHSFDSRRLTSWMVTLASIGHTWILWIPNNECGVNLFLLVYSSFSTQVTQVVNCQPDPHYQAYDFRVILLFPQVGR